jgi:hypothetical protein
MSLLTITPRHRCYQHCVSFGYGSFESTVDARGVTLNKHLSINSINAGYQLASHLTVNGTQTG